MDLTNETLLKEKLLKVRMGAGRGAAYRMYTTTKRR
jgi:hypothetical protein